MPSPPVASPNSPAVQFGASWSRSTCLLTSLFLLCALVCCGLSFSGSVQAPIFLSTVALIAVVIGYVWALAPTGYLVDRRGVSIRRRRGPKLLALSSLRAARLMDPAELAQVTWRWPAVGGLFGFYGWFETPALGRHLWYATRDEGLVLIQTEQGPIVLSPDDPAAFVREVNQRLRSAVRIS